MDRFKLSFITTFSLVFLTLFSVSISVFVYLEAISIDKRRTQSDTFINISQYQHEMFQTRNIIAQLIHNPQDENIRREFNKWFDIVWSRTNSLDKGSIGQELKLYGLQIEKVLSQINQIDELAQSSAQLTKNDLHLIQSTLNKIIADTQSFIITAEAKRDEFEDEERQKLYKALEYVVALNCLTFLFGALSIYIVYRKNTQLKRLHENLETRVKERTEELEEKKNILAAENEERKKIETELRQSKQKTENANRSKTQFLANMSHELRTPLNAIIGFADIMHMELLGPIENPKYKGYLIDIVTSGRHLSALLKNILDLSKIEAQEMEIQPEEIDLEKTINDSVVLLTPNLHSKQHKLEANIQEGLRVYFDTTHLQQILLNLISNAIKYTPSRGMLKINTYVNKNGSIQIDITDNGPGIPNDKIEYILKPFHRLLDSSTSNESGTGIGLSISKQLAHLHGGELIITSEYTKGTTSSLVIPVERVIK